MLTSDNGPTYAGGVDFKYFNKGKALLESSIQNNSSSIELRFLRYSIQVNLPRILLYYQVVLLITQLYQVGWKLMLLKILM